MCTHAGLYVHMYMGVCGDMHICDLCIYWDQRLTLDVTPHNSPPIYYYYFLRQGLPLCLGLTDLPISVSLAPGMYNPTPKFSHVC